MEQGKPKTPFRRDYFREAIRIAQGEKLQPKKEHILSLTNHIIELDKKMAKLDALMKVVYEEARARRLEKGLPVPPPPPSMKDIPKGFMK